MNRVRHLAWLFGTSLLLGAAPPAKSTTKTVQPLKRPQLLGRLRPDLRKRSAQKRIAPKPKREALPKCEGMAVLPTYDTRPFAIGEELSYELTVAGAYLGRFETKVGKPRRVGGETVIPLFGRARTNSFVSAIQPFAGRYMAMVNPETLRPVGLRVEAKFGDDDRWEKVKFSKDLVKATVDYRLKGHERRRDWMTDHQLTDLLSMLYAARSVRITPGATACQDVFGARRLWRMDAKVEGIEKVDTPVGKKDAFKVATKFLRKNHRTLSRTNRPRAEVDIYFAADGSQTPLKFVVRSQGVEATGTLVRWSLEGGSSEDTWGI